MVFESVKQFRTALQDYVVQRKVQIKLRPNEQHKVRAKYVNSTRCKWHILGSLEGHIWNFIVSSYYHVHKYFRATRNKMANKAWIAKHFKDKIINQPHIKLRKLQDLIKIKYGVYMEKSIYDRTKHQRPTNPSNTFIVKTSKETIPGKEGVCKGELLSCIGKDGKNQMYPVAWAMVEKETKNTWSWFFRCLMHDLQLIESQGEEGLTIISEMQKGLVQSVVELMPNAEHRMCARHIWSNSKQKWEGEERKKSSGAFFKDWSECDYVENNMCETFNSWIMSARRKSIITMLEEIRVKKEQGSGTAGTRNTNVTQGTTAASGSGTTGIRKINHLMLLKEQLNHQLLQVVLGLLVPEILKHLRLQVDLELLLPEILIHQLLQDTGSMRSRILRIFYLVLEEGQELLDFEEDQELLDLCGSRDKVLFASSKIVDDG
ncbi:uncharacterized protein [Nicotiana tomentosiformis]|uniref:uncharacterized protein n=1 Tax=Nicotiana tomentosiformis TaxID=4098 RepID=UPI00388C8554